MHGKREWPGCSAELAGAGVETAARAIEKPAPEPLLEPDSGDGPNRVVILLVEDDPGDQDLIRRAFEDCQGQVDLRVVKDGEEALDYLNGAGTYEGAHRPPQPRLIILDLNLPKLTGHQILHELRRNPSFPAIPIVVLTSSAQDPDIIRSYELGANSYFTKPTSFDGYCRMIRVLEAYWLRRAELPPTR